jgi:hypothetical protein
MMKIMTNAFRDFWMLSCTHYSLFLFFFWFRHTIDRTPCASPFTHRLCYRACFCSSLAKKHAKSKLFMYTHTKWWVLLLCCCWKYEFGLRAYDFTVVVCLIAVSLAARTDGWLRSTTTMRYMRLQKALDYLTGRRELSSDAFRPFVGATFPLLGERSGAITQLGDKP